jgi:MFS family permease
MGRECGCHRVPAGGQQRGGRVGGGILSDRIGRKNTMLLVFSMQLLNMLAFIHCTSLPLMAFGAVVAGVSYGSLMSVFPSTTADSWGMEGYGTNYGVLYLAWSVSGVMGPLIAAKLGGQHRHLRMGVQHRGHFARHCHCVWPADPARDNATAQTSLIKR